MRQPALTKSVSVWQVEFHDDFDPEFDALEKDVQNVLIEQQALGGSKEKSLKNLKKKR